ncbi:hypothetical protein NMY22_g17834 [Coprinellus aureogranulatus]|nr:hypothetical protein NMY22_g17834 [Coprinellus aureogranulatus]
MSPTVPTFRLGQDTRIPKPDSTKPEQLNSNWDTLARQSQLCCEVAKQLFANEIGASNKGFSIHIPDDVRHLMADLLQAVRVCARAWSQPEVLHNMSFQEVLERRLPGHDVKFTTKRRDPFVLVDTNEDVLMWYLPGVVSTRLQHMAGNALIQWQAEHPHCVERCGRASDTEYDHALYRAEADVPRFGAGVGHFDYLLHYTNRDRTVREHLVAEQVDFFSRVSPLLCILSAISAVTTPLQADQGWTLQSRLAKANRMEDRDLVLRLLETWGLPFELFDLHINLARRRSRTSLSGPYGYSMYTTFGDYPAGTLTLPTLLMECNYRPGTAVVITANMPFGVPQVSGERFEFKLTPSSMVRNYQTNCSLKKLSNISEAAEAWASSKEAFRALGVTSFVGYDSIPTLSYPNPR